MKNPCLLPLALGTVNNISRDRIGCVPNAAVQMFHDTIRRLAAETGLDDVGNLGIEALAITPAPRARPPLPSWATGGHVPRLPEPSIEDILDLGRLIGAIGKEPATSATPAGPVGPSGHPGDPGAPNYLPDPATDELLDLGRLIIDIVADDPRREHSYADTHSIFWVGPSRWSEQQRVELEKEGYVIPDHRGLMMSRDWWYHNVKNGPGKDSPGAAYDELANVEGAVAIFFPGPVPPWLLAEMHYRNTAYTDDTGEVPPDGLPVYTAEYHQSPSRPHPDVVHAPDVNTGFIRWVQVGHVFKNDIGPNGS